MTREEYLKMFKENQELKAIFESAANTAEKRAIKAYTEDFVSNFYDNVFGPMLKAMEKDPDVFNKALTDLENELINEKESQESK